jgi:hypothetical protein
MRGRIYVDASVVGGCEDDEFAEPSVRLMEGFAKGALVLVISDLRHLQRRTSLPAFFQPGCVPTHNISPSRPSLASTSW